MVFIHLKSLDYLDKSSKENLRFQIENKIIDVVVKYYEFLNIKQTNNGTARNISNF